jgi:histidyl-tRNA synthetase
MAKIIPGIRGMNDILPEEMPYWLFLEKKCLELMHRYGYHGIRFPVLEHTELFKRTIGESTDVVEKEMYTFADRNGDSLSLRPEGTAGCVRAGIEHSLFYNQEQRLWYLGPMFRHERPQKGRYRQFFQLGVEAFGLSGPFIEAELILISYRLWKELGLSSAVELQMNSLGTPACRAAYRQQLITYFEPLYDRLDADSQRRLHTNPLRILDSKNPDMQSLIANAPKLMNHLDASSKAHFEQLCALLSTYSIPYKINPALVRGLDYYTHTVFEWVTDQLGSQGTICAGGRYDGLVEQLGGGSVPAAGFALGLERIVLLLQGQHSRVESREIYCIFMGETALQQGLGIAERLRDAFPQMSIETSLSDARLKNQLKRADKSQARWAVIIGDAEVSAGQLLLKDLRNEAPQRLLSLEELIRYLDENNHVK